MNNDAISVKEHRIVIVIIEITQTSKFTFFSRNNSLKKCILKYNEKSLTMVDYVRRFKQLPQ